MVGFILTWQGCGPENPIQDGSCCLEFAREEPISPTQTLFLNPSSPPFSLCPPPVPPTIEQWAESSGTLVSRPGELVTMACPVQGSAPIRVSWLKDGLPLPLSQRTRLHSSGRTLR